MLKYEPTRQHVEIEITSVQAPKQAVEEVIRVDR
jgi:hypothetical protein